jgi:hypothetical protein
MKRETVCIKHFGHYNLMSSRRAAGVGVGIGVGAGLTVTLPRLVFKDGIEARVYPT